MGVLISLFILSGWTPFLEASENEKKEKSNLGSVILVTLDGVRWKEIFRGLDPEIIKKTNSQSQLEGIAAPLIPFLLPEKNGGKCVGNRDLGDEIIVKNPAYASLPAYQTIMAGAVQLCRSNACGRIGVQTFPEKILEKLNVEKTQVATIASWEKINMAVEHKTGALFLNSGVQPLLDGGTDSELADLNKSQATDKPPWSNARWDRFTFSHAIRYLKRHQPKFLFISFNDSDEWAHKNKYPEYVKSIQQYNAWLYRLQETIEEKLKDKPTETTLIVTTDHGRGDLDDWTDHGSGYPESKYVWIYMKRYGSPKKDKAKKAEKTQEAKEAAQEAAKNEKEPGLAETHRRDLAAGLYRELHSRSSHLDLRAIIESSLGLN